MSELGGSPRMPSFPAVLQETKVFPPPAFLCPGPSVWNVPRASLAWLLHSPLCPVAPRLHPTPVALYPFACLHRMYGVRCECALPVCTQSPSPRCGLP